VRPEDVGLVAGARRRVEGLRREELAMLAGISAEYYLRLEVGRDKNPSAQVVEALARALRLNIKATRYLHQLANPVICHWDQSVLDAVVEGLDELIDQLPFPVDQLPFPAIVASRYQDVLATSCGRCRTPLPGRLLTGGLGCWAQRRLSHQSHESLQVGSPRCARLRATNRCAP
jgi:transcriptional regulator with XRE-family HTH domain